MFRSFFMAGFECATGYNMHGEWIDQVEATEHDVQVDADYALSAEAGLCVAREAIRWPLCDKGGGRYDFRTVKPFVSASVRHGVEVIWDLFHYGFPAGVDLYSAEFPRRFAAYCGAAARYVYEHTPGPHYFTPINEGSYFAWAAGERALFAPHVRGRGHELKIALARAAIAGVEAIRRECPEARIVSVDPICHVVPPLGAPPAVIDGARHFNEQVVFQFFDMMAGTLHPELGGSREHLDIVGLNYYWTNQWQVGEEGTPLADDDIRRLPIGELVRRAWTRYGGDILITETSALGDARAPWLDELSAMSCQLLEEGVPLRGICLYPILGMPEWHMREQWTRMGLWDAELESGVLRRVPHVPMMQALKRGQHMVSSKQRTLGRVIGDTKSAPMSVLLPRTGGSPFAFRGRPIWEDGATQPIYRLRVFRADDGLWVAAVEVRWGERTVRRVISALEIDAFSELLNHYDPVRVLHESNVSSRPDEQIVLSWHRDVRTATAVVVSKSERGSSAAAAARVRSERP